MEKKLTLVQEINQELQLQTNDPSTMRALMATTFKGFDDERMVKQACLEAMMNGWTFQDLVRKKVYAVRFGNSYSLVQSIDDVREIAMNSGQSGKSAPSYTYGPNGIIESCSVTVWKKGGDERGFTSTVFFDEYNKGRDNWKTKPRTMIAKVAEMHALRMAFPAELAKAYIEDEFTEDNERYSSKSINSTINNSNLKMGNLLKNNEKKDEDFDHQDNQETNDTTPSVEIE